MNALKVGLSLIWLAWAMGMVTFVYGASYMFAQFAGASSPLSWCLIATTFTAGSIIWGNRIIRFLIETAKRQFTS
jgi:hypothetical protein